MTRLRALTLAAVGAAALAGCDAKAPGSPDGLTIAVAPLQLKSLSNVCYDVRVTNAADGAGDVVWSKGTPGLNGGTADPDAVCSTQFGNLAGGDITYIGPCDADGDEDPSRPGGERTNSVTVWFDGLYDDTGAYIDPTGPDGWQNPCVDATGAEVGCTLNVLCRENADTPVDFNFTVMRQANQGFFDVAVNFNDIFCSAKFDCSTEVDGVCSGGTCTTGTLAAGLDACTGNADCRAQDPINLLHDADGNRARTFVLGFACTAGPGTSVDTALYLNDLEVDCGADGDPGVFTPDFTLSTSGTVDGNQCDAGAMSGCPIVNAADDLDADQYFYQMAVYRGDELLTDSVSGEPLNKKYWNVALGVRPDIAGCRIRVAGTAEDANDPNDGANDRSILAGHTYPVIAWDVDAGTCTQEPLTVRPGAGSFARGLIVPSMVSIGYTAPTTEAIGFDHTSADAHRASAAAIPSLLQTTCSDKNPCDAGYTCKNSGECRNDDGSPQGTCRSRDLFDPSVTTFEVPAKSAGSWVRLADNRGAVQLLNGPATIYPSRVDAAGHELVFTIGVLKPSGDGDVIGWVVGAAGNPNHPPAKDGHIVPADGSSFMLFDWLASPNPGSVGPTARGSGLRMSRVSAKAGGASVTTAELQGPLQSGASAVTELQSAATRGTLPWVRGRVYQVRMQYSTTRIQVWVADSVGGAEALEFDLTGTFPVGKLGIYAMSQEATALRILEIDGVATDALPCGYTPIAPGSFLMGSPESEAGRWPNETQHLVTLTRRFEMRETETTQAEWTAVLPGNPSNYPGPSRPVEHASWYSVLAFADALSAKLGLTPCYTLIGCDSGTSAADGTLDCQDVSFAGLDCTGYRLPTEAEWEYAARAGTTGPRYNEPGSVSDIAWWYESAPHGVNDNLTSAVGLKAPNGWGLYDMLGNAWEFTGDRLSGGTGDWIQTVAPSSSTVDPTGDGTGDGVVIKGLCKDDGWERGVDDIRVAQRRGPRAFEQHLDRGFRLVRTLPPAP